MTVLWNGAYYSEQGSFRPSESPYAVCDGAETEGDEHKPTHTPQTPPRIRRYITEFKFKPLFVDRVLARHYGFTDEELDHILNYDIKVRLGAEGAEGEDA